ncbi:hypothetical protein SAMN04488057_101512 [Cyclobacterium lianum]|uniref:DUF4168 domain-containing protein n=1 Tax=Cyclobacterium lianum TaxID=388280 RepID=A0A1M7IZK4_9BACT|nr:hypothetical protein [Cyclobacterium lianum]SHM45637.1 hypothetical protein SAMN04488057_101512 [Cyclobacterium lianum]
MTYSKLLNASLFSLLLSVCFAYGSIAQQLPQGGQKVNDNFTDEEYEQFVTINQSLAPMQAEVEAKMVGILEDKGMEVPRFQALMQAQRQGNIMDATDDPDEIALFNEAGQEIMKVQQESQQELQQHIVDNGMEIQKFQEMSIAYNQSPKVKEKVDAKMEEIENQ